MGLAPRTQGARRKRRILEVQRAGQGTRVRHHFFPSGAMHYLPRAGSKIPRLITSPLLSKALMYLTRNIGKKGEMRVKMPRRN